MKSFVLFLIFVLSCGSFGLAGSLTLEQEMKTASVLLPMEINKGVRWIAVDYQPGVSFAYIYTLTGIKEFDKEKAEPIIAYLRKTIPLAFCSQMPDYFIEELKKEKIPVKYVYMTMDYHEIALLTVGYESCGEIVNQSEKEGL